MLRQPKRTQHASLGRQGHQGLLRNIRKRHLRARGQPVVAAHRNHDRLLRHHHMGALRVRSCPQPGETRIALFRAHPSQRIRPRNIPGLQLPPHLPQSGGQPAGQPATNTGLQPHNQRRRMQLAQPRQLGTGLVPLRQQHAGPPKQILPRRRQPHQPVVTL